MAWLAVIVGSLLLASSVTLAPHRGDARSAAASDVGTQAVASTSLPRPRSIAESQSGGREPSPVDATQAPTATDALPSVDAFLLVGWAAGSALCLAVLIVSAWRVARMRRAWRESVIAGVPVLVSHDVGPAVIGLVHHGIVVPAWVEALREDEQRTVMTHEREHVRAGDPLLLWSATLLVTLVPWNAALWYALRRLRHAIEMDCDARVLRSRPDMRAYCTLLLDVGERTLAGVAPVAALAEPATVLERRINAMTATACASRRRVALGAIAAMSLVAIACWAPRPEVAPRARMAALVTELYSRLASDSARHTLTDADRASAAHALESAVAAEALARPSASESPALSYGTRVDSLARVDYPDAYRNQSDDAIVVAVLFDADARIIRSYRKRLRVDEVFDVVPGAAGQPLTMRNAGYLLSRTVPSPLPQLRSAGSQTEHDAPRAVFVYGVLVPGASAPPESSNAPQQSVRQSSSLIGADGRVTSNGADSTARALYPDAYTSHDGIVVVGLIFSADGQLIQHASRLAEHDEVYVPRRDGSLRQGESAKRGTDLLSLLFADAPQWAGRWSVIAHRSAAGPALVWTVLSAGLPVPAVRRDIARARAPSSAVPPQPGDQSIAEVTLSSPSSPPGRVVLVYRASGNGVERRLNVKPSDDTLRVTLPATLPVVFGVWDELHFVSVDDSAFEFVAVVGTHAKHSSVGKHIVAEAGGTQLRVIK